MNPKLLGKAVVVLSNNDGCIISRSNEAKSLGIRMGEPYFQAKQRFGNCFIALSSNFELYADLSDRVMKVLAEACPFIEFYSIDESFLQLSEIPLNQLEAFAIALRKEVFKNTGIPVSIGIAKTKVLSKLANHVAKKFHQNGVACLLEKIVIDKWLTNFPVDEIWGIGRRLKNKLEKIGIVTAKHLQEASPIIMKQKFSVVLAQINYELNGISCFQLEKEKPKKSITCSRSFGQLLTDLEHIKEALAYFVARASLKLRNQKHQAKSILIFLQTNRYRLDLKQDFAEIVINLPFPTSDTRVITEYAFKGLSQIWRPGYWYNKTGVILLNIIHPEKETLPLWQDERIKGGKVMQVLDEVNERFGKRALFLASEGTKTMKPWLARRENLSIVSSDIDNLLKVK